MSDLSVFSRAAESVLASDRAKGDEFGGRKFGLVERVEVGEDASTEMPAVVLTRSDGVIMSSLIMPHSINRPKDREIRPADVHDAVRAAMLNALAA